MHSKLSRNLLIHRQITELAAAAAEKNISCILLKGAALVELFPAYSFTRVMDDIDILFDPRRIAAARALLLSLQYRPCRNDPWAYRHPDCAARPAPIDITDSLWYLTSRELDTALAESMPLPSSARIPARCLKPVDMYIHIAAHAAVHHGTREEVWLKDMAEMNKHWGDLLKENEGKKKLAAYGLLKPVEAYITAGETGGLYAAFLRSGSPHKGHIMRFLYLPLARKCMYLAKTVFPSDAFIAARYNVSHALTIQLYRFFLRPLLLGRQLFAFMVSSFRGRPSS